MTFWIHCISWQCDLSGGDSQFCLGSDLLDLRTGCEIVVSGKVCNFKGLIKIWEFHSFLCTRFCLEMCSVTFVFLHSHDEFGLSGPVLVTPSSASDLLDLRTGCEIV